LPLRLNIVSHSEKETLALAEKLAPHFRPGDVIVLTGELGAGKTVFVRGLARARGLNGEVNSPTFTIVNEYAGKQPLYHFDLYRVDDPTELYETGWDDYLQREGLVVVEWGEKAGDKLPTSHYVVEFRIVDEETREINVSHVQP